METVVTTIEGKESGLDDYSNIGGKILEFKCENLIWVDYHCFTLCQGNNFFWVGEFSGFPCTCHVRIISQFYNWSILVSL